MHHRRVIPTTESSSYLWERESREFTTDVHSDLSLSREWLSS
jgi:hypothetical protein